MIIGYLSQFFEQKSFKLFSLVYAILLELLNLVHLGETIIVLDIKNYTQIILLLFVVVVNIVLIILLKKWCNTIVKSIE